MREEAGVVGWIDFLDDRSEPDHVETLFAVGKPAEARRVLEHLEWRGRTLPRPWIEAGLPRARALVLAAEGKLSEHSRSWTRRHRSGRCRSSTPACSW